MSECVFCNIVDGAPVRELKDHGSVISFEPLGPQVPGHRLFVPKKHVADAVEHLWLSSQVFRTAARYVSDLGIPANIITSVGAAATQSVFHLHIHVLPRGPEDGLRPSWPWIKGNQN